MDDFDAELEDFTEEVAAPNIVYGTPGEYTPEEMQEMQTMSRLAIVTPTSTQKATMRGIERGRQSVQDQVSRGFIPPELGMSMLQQMGQQAQPLMIQAREVPVLQARLQFIRLQRQSAMQEAIFAQNMAFRARTVGDRTHQVGEMTVFEQPDGRVTAVQGRVASRAVTPADREALARQQAQARVASENRNFARTQINQYRRDNPGATPEQVEAEMNRIQESIADFNRRFNPPDEIRQTGPVGAVAGGASAQSAPAPLLGGRPERDAPPPPLPPAVLTSLQEATARIPSGLQSVVQRGQLSAASARIQGLQATQQRQGGRLTQAQTVQMLEAIDFIERMGAAADADALDGTASGPA